MNVVLMIVLAILALADIVKCHTVDDCPSQVLQTTDTKSLRVLGHTCYEFQRYMHRNNKQAAMECKAKSGFLAMPKSAEVQKFLAESWQTEFGLRDKAWIGLHDDVNEGEFLWADGTVLNEEDFSQWAPGYPWVNGKSAMAEAQRFDEERDCVTMKLSSTFDEGNWTTTECWEQRKHAFACEYKIEA